jgi:tetratricopeptide (TPR) repeat protein
MSENELKDTQPNPANGGMGATRPNPVSDDMGATQPHPVNPESSPASGRKFPGWLAVLVLVVLIVIGILGGYASGMGRRLSAQKTQVTGQLQEQYQLGEEAFKAGQYEVARQHFEFIIEHNPDFPGVKAAYANLLLQMLVTPTLTPTLTPTITPTPDTRSVDAIYNDLKALLSAPGADLCGRDWNGIISKLDSLRKADINFHPAEVDGMYYISLRNRGLCKIYPQTYQPNASCEALNINLEGGIYDLTQAESFGPLDSTADGLRTWARLYIAGASFWDQDWIQVLDYFSQVRASVPNLADNTCTSATERWRQANIAYANQLMSKGDFCAAERYFTDAFSVDSPKNAEVFPVATQASDECNGDGGTPKPKKTKTPGPTNTPTP